MIKQDKTKTLKNVIIFYAYLLIIWGFYRILFFQFPQGIEIIILKPIFWLIPLFYFARKQQLTLKDLGIKKENLFISIYISLILGVIFTFEGVIVNLIKYQGFNFNANLGQGAFLTSFVLSFVTATSEELVFRGYFFTQFAKILKHEWLANITTSLGWTLIHLPIAIFDWRLSPVSLLNYLILIMLFSIGACFVFAKTKNISSSIFLHVLWQWPIILFR